jgi:hypothetical protein
MNNVNLKSKITDNNAYVKLPYVFLFAGLFFLSIWGYFFYMIDKERSLYAYLFSFISILSIVLGCMIFVLLQHVTRAGWSVVIRRVPEVAMNTIPLFFILFIPIALFSGDIFPWSHISHEDAVLNAKAPYLNKTFFYIRSFFYFVVWFIISRWFFNKSISQDDSKREEESRKIWKFSGPSIILFGLTTTFASFDWIMSLQPHWYSTIFGVYYFSGSIIAGMCFLTLLYLLIQKSGLLLRVVTKEHYQDLGKLIFGFIIFWAYIAFSQFILIWYANIPEETEFYMHRLGNGWEYLTWIIPLIHFFIPFFLLMSKHLKRNNLIIGFICIYILLVHFIDMYWLVMPNMGLHSAINSALELNHNFNFKISDLLSFFGILFLFLSLFFHMLKKYYLLPNGDPRIRESISFENF